jgi:hypothetical protein
MGIDTYGRRCEKFALRVGVHCTLGWADAVPTPWAAESRLSALKAIHAPLIATTTAPNGTVTGVLAGPIVDPYTRLKYISTFAAAHRAPAHLGNVPERQTATPRRMLPTKASKKNSSPVSPNMVSAKMEGSLAYCSMPARYACPSLGAARYTLTWRLSYSGTAFGCSTI